MITLIALLEPVRSYPSEKNTPWRHEVVASNRQAWQEHFKQPDVTDIDYTFIVWDGKAESLGPLFCMLADARRHHLPLVGVLGPYGDYPLPEVTETSTIVYFSESSEYFQDRKWQWEKMIEYMNRLVEEFKRDPSLV